MLASLALTWALLVNGWTAFSLIATFAGAGGLVLIVVALLATAWLPAFLRHALLIAGVCVLAGAALFQAGQARGAHQAFARDVERARLAEAKRTDLAEAVERQDRLEAQRDLADERTHSKKLQGMLDVLAKDPGRNRVCGTLDDTRRLRDL